MSPTDGIEEHIAQCRAESAKRMQISEVAAGFQVIEAPAGDGAPFKAWLPTFQTRPAAELFLEELLNVYAWCDPDDTEGASAIGAEHYEEMARLWECLEQQQGVADPRELARALCSLRPWERRGEDPPGQNPVSMGAGMGKVFKLPLPDLIGRGCPTCKRYSAILNVGLDHWAYCEVHGFRWCLGTNLFAPLSEGAESAWPEETEADWDRNAQYLSRFTDAEFFGGPTNGGGAA